VVFSSRNLGCVQVKCLKFQNFSGRFKYARAKMRIGRYVADFSNFLEISKQIEEGKVKTPPKWKR